MYPNATPLVNIRWEAKLDTRTPLVHRNVHSKKGTKRFSMITYSAGGDTIHTLQMLGRLCSTSSRSRRYRFEALALILSFSAYYRILEVNTIQS